MKFNYAPPVPEWTTYKLEGSDCSFEVNRAGHPAWRRRLMSRFGTSVYEALQRKAQEQGKTLADFRELGEEEMQKLLDSMDFEDVGGLDRLQAISELDYEGVARCLVRKQIGDLIADENGSRIAWNQIFEVEEVVDGETKHRSASAGQLFLEAHPAVAEEIIRTADALERDYQDAKEASLGNSSTSSGPRRVREEASDSSEPQNKSDTAAAV